MIDRALIGSLRRERDFYSWLPTMSWWPMLLGWPLIMLALGVGGLGIYLSKSGLLYLAALLALPLSLYLAITPRFAFVGLLVPAALAISGLVLRRGHRVPAIVLIAAVFVFFGWLALAVTNA